VVFTVMSRPCAVAAEDPYVVQFLSKATQGGLRRLAGPPKDTAMSRPGAVAAEDSFVAAGLSAYDTAGDQSLKSKISRSQISLLLAVCV
jgi:hypothetical protein